MFDPNLRIKVQQLLNKLKESLSNWILSIKNDYIFELIIFLCLGTQYGLDRILEEEKCLSLLAKAIDPTQPSMMMDVVKLLSAICIVGEENTYVLK